MSFEVVEHSLDSLCLLVVDCPHATPEWTTEGFIVLRNQNIKGGRLDLTAPSYTDEAHYLGRVRRAAPQAGDIVITREAPMGEVCQIPAGLKCCLGQRQVLLRPDRTKVDSRFLLYALQSSFVQHQIGWNEGTGSTVSNLRIPVLKAIKVPTPPVAVQKEIALILGAIDDRISLLRKTNDTLEIITKAIFKSWFVDFEPVRAKVEGRQPEGMNVATAALFPDGFQETELGAVPKGWRTGSILDIANLISGGTPKTDRAEFWGGDVPWASAKDVSQSSNSFLTETERNITSVGLQKSSTKMIPAYSSVVVARGATTGRMVMFGRPMAMNQTCYALESKSGTPIALYLVLRKEIEALTQKAHGSIFDTITTSTFAASKTLLIPNTLLACFEDIAAPLFHRILIGTQKAQALILLRDTLLPRLISGQLRLPEVEELVEEACA